MPETSPAFCARSTSRRNEIAGDFINTLVATEVERGLIVIDDAHRIRDPALFGFLDRVAAVFGHAREGLPAAAFEATLDFIRPLLDQRALRKLEASLG